MLFPASREAGLHRLAAFVPRARDYARLRNFDFGPGDRSNVSGLSPYLRHRLLTEAEVLTAVLHTHPVSSVEKFIDEVFWRGYFKGYLEAHPQIWQRYREDRDTAIAALAADAALRARYEAAIDGRTGIEGFDHWARELRETGYLHNHARMWFASIWIFTLRLPWVLGADFTYRHFIDGDPASNTLSWRWVAGLHTPGKTYLARADNIERFTQGRFRPEGLAGHAEALSEPGFAYESVRLPSSQPCVDERAALILSEDDLDGEGLWLEAAAPQGVRPMAVAALAPAVAEISSLSIASTVTSFKTEALQRATRRVTDSFEAQAAPNFLADGRAIAEWAVAEGARTVILPYAPVGPTRDQRTSLTQSLQTHGVEIVEVTRRYDRLTWPHATAGFFKLKGKIPSILSSLGVSSGATDRQGDLFESDHA